MIAFKYKGRNTIFGETVKIILSIETKLNEMISSLILYYIKQEEELILKLKSLDNIICEIFTKTGMRIQKIINYLLSKTRYF